MGSIRLASWRFPAPWEPHRILLMGVSGSGKTSLLKQTKSDLAKSGVVLYETDFGDESNDYYLQKLKGHDIPINVITLKYSDGVGLNIAPLMGSAADRERYAKKIVGSSIGSRDDFWEAWGLILIENAAHACHKLAGGRELMADHLRILMNPDLHVEYSKLAGLGDPYRILGNNNSKRDVQATVLSKLRPYAIYSAMDMRASKRIDLPLASGILIIEMTDSFIGALSGIASFVFDTVTDRLLSRQSSNQAAFVIDEFRELQQLDCIGAIARRGRKSGISLLLTAHSTSGVIDRYGEHKADEIFGLLDHKIFLRIGSVNTATFASEYLGHVEVLESIKPASTDGKATGISQRVTMRPNVIPDELRRLPMPDFDRDVITGWADFPHETKPFKCSFKKDVVLDKKPAPRPLRPASDQILPRLNAADLMRLGFPSATKELLELL